MSSVFALFVMSHYFTATMRRSP